jgi:hypothetical protein
LAEKALHSKKLEGKEAQKGRSVRALVAETAWLSKVIIALRGAAPIDQ